jgi:RNA polymerase sigma factor (sigma-70 family)
VKRDARDRIVAEHLDLVRAIARGVCGKVPPVFSFDDLVAEGNVALICAAEKYNPSAHNGTPFSAFARRRIRGAMIEMCRRKRYTEATRPSINAPSSTDERLSRSYDVSCGFDGFDSEIARALRRMATPPSAEQAIDAERLENRIREAVSWLPLNQRQLLDAIYFAGDGLPVYLAARRLRITRAHAEELHGRAIAGIHARLTPGSPIPRGDSKGART